MDKNTEDQIITSAAAGFAQSLINRGWPEDQVKNACAIYTNGQQGLLLKRANTIATFKNAVIARAKNLGTAPAAQA